MSQKNTNYVICPCCQQERHKTEIKKSTKLLEDLERKTLKHYSAIESNVFGRFKNEHFEWACDYCYENDLVMEANPTQQLYLDYEPYLAFFDSKKTCEKCKIDYLFSKEEKRFWYEELQFWVQSKPKHCMPCRKTIRAEKEAVKNLSSLLKRFDELTVEELEEVIEIYKKMGKEDRVKYYQSIKRKRK